MFYVFIIGKGASFISLWVHFIMLCAVIVGKCALFCFVICTLHYVMSTYNRVRSTICFNLCILNDVMYTVYGSALCSFHLVI